MAMQKLRPKIRKSKTIRIKNRSVCLKESTKEKLDKMKNKSAFLDNCIKDYLKYIFKPSLIVNDKRVITSVGLSKESNDKLLEMRDKGEIESISAFLDDVILFGFSEMSKSNTNYPKIQEYKNEFGLKEGWRPSYAPKRIEY